MRARCDFVPNSDCNQTHSVSDSLIACFISWYKIMYVAQTTVLYQYPFQPFHTGNLGRQPVNIDSSLAGM